MLIGAFAVSKVVNNTSQQQSMIAQNAVLAEQESAREKATQALHAKSDIIGAFMARTAPDLIAAYDFISLKSYQQDATRDKDIIYAAYLNSQGDVLTEFQKPEDAADIIEKKYPITYENENLGHILLGISTESVKRGIAESNARISETIREVGNSGDAAVKSFMILTAIEVVAVLVVISGIILVLFRVAVIKPTNETIGLIKQLSEGKGDLTIRLPTQNSDEISDLRRSVNEFVQQLQSMIAAIVKEVNDLTGEANEVRRYGIELAMTADSQQMETVQAAISMNEMVATVQEVARNTNAAADAATNADTQAKEGTLVVQHTTATINQLASQVEYSAEAVQALAKDSLGIGSVLDVIKGIAEQTNLLALNAAIEAARAGEQGRGFAVVADEVRTLALRTQQSTQEIQEMIERLQSGAHNAVTAMEKGREQAQQGVQRVTQAGEALQTISKTVAIIHEMNTQIAAASEEQATVAEEINRSIASIKESSDKTTKSAAQTGESSENLSNVASHLEKLVGQFVIN
ncbi:MAG: methyl-accepting chemotaxis protein [Gammaproteobacteria bacterium]